MDIRRRKLCFFHLWGGFGKTEDSCCRLDLSRSCKITKAVKSNSQRSNFYFGHIHLFAVNFPKHTFSGDWETWIISSYYQQRCIWNCWWKQTKTWRSTSCWRNEGWRKSGFDPCGDCGTKSSESSRYRERSGYTHSAFDIYIVLLFWNRLWDVKILSFNTLIFSRFKPLPNLFQALYHKTTTRFKSSKSILIYKRGERRGTRGELVWYQEDRFIIILDVLLPQFHSAPPSRLCGFNQTFRRTGPS